MTELYQAWTYAADGHGEPADLVGSGTLEECRRAVAARFGDVSKARRWDGLDGDVEAYRERLPDEPGAEGCGGVAIRRVS
jgi:hypothetical protein